VSCQPKNFFGTPHPPEHTMCSGAVYTAACDKMMTLLLCLKTLSITVQKHFNQKKSTVYVLVGDRVHSGRVGIPKESFGYLAEYIPLTPQQIYLCRSPHIHVLCAWQPNPLSQHSNVLKYFRFFCSDFVRLLLFNLSKKTLAKKKIEI
jgi:hypothetical protein